MSKLFDGVCVTPGCNKQNEVVETWADGIKTVDNGAQILVGAECEECRQKLLRVLSPIATVTGPKSGPDAHEAIRYYNFYGDTPPRVGSLVVVEDPTVGVQEGPIKIGEVFDITNPKD